MQYRVVEARTADELAVEVTRLLADGWTPHGSMSVIQSANGRWFFYQPLTRLPVAVPAG